MARLDGKVAIITGAAAGMGKETAKLFLEEGAKVMMVDFDEETLNESYEELKDLGQAVQFVADVTDEEKTKEFIDLTVDELGPVDIYFANAGTQGSVAPVEDQKIEDFKWVLDLNVVGPFLGMKHVFPIMKENGGGSYIINSSGAAYMGSPSLAPYTTSKHAVTGLIRTAALEVARDNIRVNSVNPTAIETDMMKRIEEGVNPEDSASARKAFEEGIPMGRYGSPREVAQLVAFLASDDAGFISGEQIRIDGGQAGR